MQKENRRRMQKKYKHLKEIIMKKTTILIFLSAILTTGLSADTGGRPMQGIYGAETVGKGGTVTATVNNPSAIFWNPAGLAHINGITQTEESIEKEAEEAFGTESNPIPEKFWEGSNEDKEEKDKSNALRSFEMQIFTAYSHLTLDRQVALGAIGFTALKGTIGIGFLGTQVLGIDGYDSSGASTGAIDYQFGAVILAYAWESGPSKFGVSGTYMSEYLGGPSVNGANLNAGWQFDPIPIISLGVNLQNIAGMYQETAATDSYEKMDTIMDLALAILPPSTNIEILFGFRNNLDAEETSSFTSRMGLVIPITQSMFLMGGVEGENLSFGAGINLNFLKFSYAVNQDPLRTGFQHHVDLNFKF